VANQAVVQILIKARDEASRVLEGVAASGDRLNLALSAIGAAGMAVATKLTLTAARTEELGVVVEAMGRAHGYSVEKIALLEESLKRMGIRTQAARLLTAQLIGSQVGLARATDIARAAQDLATLGAVESSEAAADLAYSIASLQPRLLRKYRIYISLVNVYRKAAQELDKNILALTETEKRQAFLNAVLEEAARYANLYETAMTTAGKLIRSMPRYVEELANEFGEHLLPILKGTIVTIQDTIAWLTALPDPLQSAMMYTVALGGAFLVLRSTIATFVPMLLNAIMSFTGLKTALLAVGLAALEMPGILAAITVALGYGIVKFKEIERTAKDKEKAIISLTKTYDRYREKMIDMLEVEGRITKGAAIYARASDDLLGGLIKTQEEFKEAKIGIEGYDMAIRAVPGSLEGFNNMLKQVGKTVAQQRTVMEGLASAMLIPMTLAYSDAERATEQYHGNVLTMERRKAYLQEQLMKKGYDDALVAEIEGINKQIHEAERGQQEMERIFRRQIAMMAVTALQQILPPVEALQAGIELLGRAQIISPATLGAGRGLIGELGRVQTGQITGMEFAERAGGILAPTPTGAPAGGVSVVIGNLYGTDRTAATKFGQQIGRDLLSLGVRTR